MLDWEENQKRGELQSQAKKVFQKDKSNKTRTKNLLGFASVEVTSHLDKSSFSGVGEIKLIGVGSKKTKGGKVKKVKNIQQDSNSIKYLFGEKKCKDGGIWKGVWAIIIAFNNGNDCIMLVCLWK